MHDLDFNPENDRQAEDRCHRIGQEKRVKVYKLVTEDTVDEDIFDMGERKSKLSKAVLSDRIEGTVNDESGSTTVNTPGGTSKKMVESGKKGASRKSGDEDDIVSRCMLVFLCAK